MKGLGTGTGCHPQLHLCSCRAGLTIHITGNLTKHGQVGLIDDRAEDPPPALFIQSKDPLPGHAKGHHPHGKEKQEEENVDQLPREEIRIVRTVPVVAMKPGHSQSATETGRGRLKDPENSSYQIAWPLIYLTPID